MSYNINIGLYLLGNHVADFRQEVLTEELVELPLSERGPLSKALSDLSPFFFCLTQEPPSTLAWSSGSYKEKSIGSHYVPCDSVKLQKSSDPPASPPQPLGLQELYTMSA